MHELAATEYENVPRVELGLDEVCSCRVTDDLTDSGETTGRSVFGDRAILELATWWSDQYTRQHGTY